MGKDNKGSRGDTIGMDLGDRESLCCVLDAVGNKLEEWSVKTTPEGVRKHFAKRAPCLVAIEAGTHSGWIGRDLKGLGYRVVVANPRQLPLISQNLRKSDRADAEMLARLARTDPKLLRPVQHRTVETQMDLVLLKSRGVLVETRTKLVNHVRGTLKSFGLRVPSCSTPVFHKRAAEVIPEGLKQVLGAVIDMLESLTERIGSYDKAVQEVSEQRYPQTKRLEQIPGVGPVTALAYTLTIENPRRFRNGRSVGNYLGLTPGTKQSSSQDPQRRITKAGDKMLRSLLVGCAHYILGPFGKDNDLKRHGMKVAARGGKNAKKRAVVAVARKLAALLLSLWKSGEVYEPNRHGLKATA